MERSRYLPTRSYGGIAPAPRGFGSPNLGRDPSWGYWAWVGPVTRCKEVSSWPGYMSPQCGGTTGAQARLCVVTGQCVPLVWKNHGGTRPG